MDKQFAMLISMHLLNVLLATTSVQRQPAAAQPAAPPDASDAEVSSPASSLTLEILKSAERGEVQRVEKWLDEGGSINARYLTTTLTTHGQASGIGLLHAAVASNQVEMVTELLRRRASVDLQTCSEVTCGYTALLTAASKGHIKILVLLLLHSADPNVQTSKGDTALLGAVGARHEACVFALLRAKANPELVDEYGMTALQWADYKGYKSIAALIRAYARTPIAAVSAAPPDASEAEVSSPGSLRVSSELTLHEVMETWKALLPKEHEYAAPSQPTAAVPAAPLDASEAKVSSHASLPLEIVVAAERGEVQRVVKWLMRNGGSIDATCVTPLANGQTRGSVTLLHVAATSGQMKLVRDLVKRGASIDLTSSHGQTPLFGAADQGHLSITLFLLHHSANPNLQDFYGATALTVAAARGHKACVQALLRAKANTEVPDKDGRTALQWAELEGHKTIAALLRQHGAPPQPTAAAPAALPDAHEPAWVALSVVLGAIATVAIRLTFTARPGQHRDVRQGRPRRPARSAKPATAVPAPRHLLRAEQAAQAREDESMEKPLVEEEAEQARSKKYKKKNKACHTSAAAGYEPSEVPPAAAANLPPAAANTPVASAAERAEAALRAANAGGRLSTLEAAPIEIGDGGAGVEAQARCDTNLLGAQQEAEREAKQEAAVEAVRLAAAERVREAAAQEAVRVAAVTNAREAAMAAAADVEAEALERATADGGSRGAAGPSEASEAEVPSEHMYMCSITAEIMTDPVYTVCRTALALGNGWAYSCTFTRCLTLPAANANRWMAIRTNAAPSNSGSRTTTPRPRRVSSWTASSLSRATVSVASFENFTRVAGGRQPRTDLKLIHERHLRKEPGRGSIGFSLAVCRMIN